jgi:hypothetical protein
MKKRTFLHFLQEHLGVIGYTILALGTMGAILGVNNLAYRNCTNANESRLADRKIYLAFRDQALSASASDPEDRQKIIVYFNKALGVPFSQQTDPTVDWAEVGHKASQECHRLW